MTVYDEFRLEITPDLEVTGRWLVHLRDCPVPNLNGPAGTITPSFTRKQLKRLRNRNGWPNDAELRAIGDTVWSSILTTDARSALEACLATRPPGRGLRIVLVTPGDDDGELGPNAVRLGELPIEALHQTKHSFLGTNLITPISRSLQREADLEPVKVSLPLRILVVVAAPSDKPEANTGLEVAAIHDALDPLVTSGALDLDFCVPPTRGELSRRLADKTYHIVHFIGHGGFAIVGNDPSPRAHLCFVREDAPTSDLLDASTFSNIIRNTDVRLVIMTACSSAAATPDQEPYDTSAFEGMAQRLLSQESQVSAAVAMQFDMEDVAAVAFTKTLYTQLLAPGRSIDEAVTHARRHLAATFNAGHRSWVTPAVFWRCRNGQVFDLTAVLGHMSPETENQLRALDELQRPYRRTLDEIQRQPAEIQQAFASLRQEYEGELQQLEQARDLLLGETLRLWGGSVAAGGTFETRLTLRLRSTGTIDLVQATVAVPVPGTTFVEAVAGEDSPTQAPIVVPKPGDQVQVTIPVPSGGQDWPPGEYELVRLRFQLPAAAPASITDLQIQASTVRRGADVLPFRPLAGLVFVQNAV